jgi:hypothetical protein
MRFVFALLAGLFMSTAWALAVPTGAPTVRQLTRNKEVRFEKIRFQVGDRLVRSAWGQVTIDGRRIARRAGVTDGFVSIRIARGWAAVNIPITTNPGQYFPAPSLMRALSTTARAPRRSCALTWAPRVRVGGSTPWPS